MNLMLKEAPKRFTRIMLACRLAEWVAFLHATVMATVVMCRVRNPACTARELPGVGLGCVDGRSIKKCLHIPFGCKRHSKDRLNTNTKIQNVDTYSMT